MRINRKIHTVPPVSNVVTGPFQNAKRTVVSDPFAYIHPDFMDEYIQATSGQRVRPRNLNDQIMLTQIANISNIFGFPDGDGHSRTQDAIERIILKNNFILIDDVVTDEMATDVRMRTQLLASAMKKTGIVKPVHFIVNSPGGSIIAMDSILDSMDRLKNTEIEGKKIVVSTICDGFAASAASVILANGSPGHRYTSPRSRVMIHQPIGFAHGQETDIAIEAKLIKRMKEQILDFFAKVTKVPREELAQIMERDYWMESNECIEKGFVDEAYNSFPTQELEESDLDGLFEDKDKK